MEEQLAATRQAAKQAAHDLNNALTRILVYVELLEADPPQLTTAAAQKESLTQIRDVSTESASLVTDISALARAQAEGTVVVGNAMKQISQIAQTTLAGAQGTVSSLGRLSQLSNDLSASMKKFRIN